MAQNPIRFHDHQDKLVCRLCGMHLALENNVIHRIAVDEQVSYAVISDMDNINFGEDQVVADGEVTDSYMTTPISCGHCSRFLGSRVYQYLLLPVVRFYVFTWKLLLRNGDMVWDANTREPIDGDGRIPILCFSNDSGNFYFCRQCQTHIAQDHDHRGRSPDQYEIFSMVINTHKGLIVNQNNHIRAPLYCDVCNTELGQMTGVLVPDSHFLNEQRIMLNPGNILYRDWN